MINMKIHCLILIHILVLCLCIKQIVAQPKSAITFDVKNITIITKLNDQTILQQAFNNDKVDRWIMSDSDSQTDRPPKVLYDLEKRLQDNQRYQCKPSLDACNNLQIIRTTQNELGQYVRSGLTSDIRPTYANYFLSAYEGPLNVKCYSDSNTCRFNQSINVLTVKENEPIVLTCSASLWRSGSYGIPGEIYYRSSTMDECTQNENKFLNNDYISTTNSQVSTSKSQNVQLKKDCARTFRREDNQMSYICGIRYAQTPEVMSTNDIDRLNIKLDVHYGPVSLLQTLPLTEFNRTIKYGNSITLKCPYEGNPITYWWKIINSPSSSSPSSVDTKEFLGEREHLLSSTLTPGSYQYQCRAYIGGYIDKTLDSVLFNVNIIESRTTAKKGNLPAIIGGSVGGAVVLILVIILVVYLVKCRQTSFKDDVNKTKENKNGGKNAPKPILRKKLDSSGEVKASNDLNAGTDDANSEFTPLGNFNKKPVSRSNNALNIELSSDVDERVPLNDKVKPSPTPSKRGVVLPPVSSTVKTYPNIKDETKGASDLLKVPDDSSRNNSYNSTNGTGGVYSPSVAEARRFDAAAPGANLTRLTKDQNLSTSKTNLAIKAGGHKVLPTDEDFKIKNQNPGESPPSYDAALKQQPAESPKLLPKHYQPMPTPQRLQAQQHHNSQTLANKEFKNSNLKLNNLQQQPQFGGSQTKLLPPSSYNTGSNKNLSGAINMNPNGVSTTTNGAQYTSTHISSNPQLNKVEYSDVVNINRARNRDPIPFNSNEQQQQQQQQQPTQYSSVAQISISKPSIV